MISEKRKRALYKAYAEGQEPRWKRVLRRAAFEMAVALVYGPLGLLWFGVFELLHRVAFGRW